MTILIAYYTRTGNTRKLAELIAEGATAAGAVVKLQTVEDTALDDLASADAIVLGTPVYYGSMAAPVKDLIDRSIKLHGKLDGKIGAAFSTSANVAGGNETAILDIICGMLIHGMIVGGDPVGDHYGPVAIGAPDERSTKLARRWGERLAKLVNKISG